MNHGKIMQKCASMSKSQWSLEAKGKKNPPLSYITLLNSDLHSRHELPSTFLPHISAQNCEGSHFISGFQSVSFLTLYHWMLICSQGQILPDCWVFLPFLLLFYYYYLYCLLLSLFNLSLWNKRCSTTFKKPLKFELPWHERILDN